MALPVGPPCGTCVLLRPRAQARQALGAFRRAARTAVGVVFYPGRCSIPYPPHRRPSAYRALPALHCCGYNGFPQASLCGFGRAREAPPSCQGLLPSGERCRNAHAAPPRLRGLLPSGCIGWTQRIGSPVSGIGKGRRVERWCSDPMPYTANTHSSASASIHLGLQPFSAGA